MVEHVRRCTLFELYIDIYRMSLASTYLRLLSVELITLLVIGCYNLLKFRLSVTMITHQVAHLTPPMLIKSIVSIMSEQEGQMLALAYKVFLLCHILP